MSNPLVSIILPSYNGSKYLHQAIESVLDQSYTNWELILVDDCSTDNTLSIMHHYQHSFPERIHCIHHEKNRKLPAALNSGFSVSKGSYLSWTSDDNLFLPDALNEMIIHLEKNPHVGLVYANYKIINEHNEGVGYKKLRYPPLFFKDGSFGACFLYKRSVHEIVGDYKEEYYLAEDFDYWLRVASKFQVAHIEKFLYLYRRHSSSLSSKNKGFV